jgi:hypothetical protein
MTINSFAPAAGTLLPISATSSNVAIPSGGTIAVVTNIGSGIAFVDIGTSGSLAATTAGLPVLPGGQAALTIGANTTLAAVTLAGLSQLNITVGN